MAIAIIATLLHPRMTAYGLSAGAVIGGAVLGAWLAARVAMTAMPELVAALHSFVGLAAVLVGVSTYLNPGVELSGGAHAVHAVEIYLDVAIGALTFTGSIIAWAKLKGSTQRQAAAAPRPPRAQRRRRPDHHRPRRALRHGPRCFRPALPAR
jgi:NAD(P) transhydrogenase subunit beta